MSLPPEILKKIKMIDLRSRKQVNNMFAGEYKSAFKGQGMTFSEFREYVPGDDVRAISWPLTARTGKTYIKKFDEERELTLVLAVDVSGSTEFGTGQYFKGERLVHLAALLAFAAVKNNDQIGLLLFSDIVELYVPPKKGRGHVHRLLRELLYFKPLHKKTSLNAPLDYLRGVLKKKAYVFLFSDFLSAEFEFSLKNLARKHEIVAVRVEDQLENRLPHVGLLEVADPETGESLVIDTDSSEFQKILKQDARDHSQELDRIFRKARVEQIKVTDEDSVDPLLAYFRSRKAKR